MTPTTTAAPQHPALRNWRIAPYQGHGTCSGCGRTHDEAGRPLHLTGKRHDHMRCRSCATGEIPGQPRLFG